MVNVLREGDGDLVPLNYGDLLDKILKVLRNPQTENPFGISGDRRRLRIEIDTIATSVATSPIDNPLGAEARFAWSAAVNFSPAFTQRFRHQIREIREGLQQQFLQRWQTVTAQTQPGKTASIDEFVAGLITELQSFQGAINAKQLGFTYPFEPQPSLQKQRLGLERNPSGSSSLLKLHKVTVTVQKINQFDNYLQEGLSKYINVQFAGASDTDREQLQEILEEPAEENQADCDRLRRVLDTETLGKLTKEAKIKYLNYLRENAGESAAVVYLDDLIRRLQLIEEYISDRSPDDGYYQVNYAGRSVNYRDLLARADAWDTLPIIPIVAGYLGETTAKNLGDRQFIFGLKIKLGNPVQAQEGKTVFDYYLNLLNPDSEAHQTKLKEPFKSQFFAEKVLKLAFLYYFVLRNFGDLSYNPIDAFEFDVLEVFNGSNEADKQIILRAIVKQLQSPSVQVSAGISQLRELLINILNRQVPSPERAYDIQIGVKRGILERDLDSILTHYTFFKPVLRGNPKEVLQYIDLGEASDDSRFFCQLPAKIAIEDIRYFRTDDRQVFSMEYDLEGIEALPVIFLPKHGGCERVYKECFMRQNKLVLFPHTLETSSLDEQQLFVYRFTFCLLAYTCLKILLDRAPQKLFVPIVRLHQGDEEHPSPPEEFMGAFSKVLSHILSDEHKSNSQGFRIKNPNLYRISNGLTSLYSVLPKKFRFPRETNSPSLVDKLAIIIVSSRESDRKRGGACKISNLMGEIVGITRLEDGSIRLEPLNTFSDNYDLETIFTEPPVVLDEVSKLYRQGYRHFFYIAKAPYSSSLNMTQTVEEDSDRLFFMSRNLMSSLKGNYADIKIYPAFFDKYYVVKLESFKSSSFYIQDTRSLATLFDDPGQQAVVFFNLFNGITVGRTKERNYNGVISYATLLNIYQGILDDRDIREGLIYENPLKSVLMQYLTLFHFSRYEKARDVSLKLDPYQNIIGDESVGKRSLFDHMTGGGTFNSLAFLTEVRKVLNVP